MSSKAAALNSMIEDLYPSHLLSQDLLVSIKQSNYYEKVNENFYCAKPRAAGNYETLQLIWAIRHEKLCLNKTTLKKHQEKINFNSYLE